MRVQSSAATRSSAGSDGAAWGGCRRLPRLRRRRGSVAGPRDEGGGGTDDRSRHGPRIKSTRSPATAMGDQGANQGLHGCDVQTRRSGFVAPPNPETDMSVTTRSQRAPQRSAPSTSKCPRRRSTSYGGGRRRRAGRTGRPSVTDRKVGGGRPFNAFDIRSVPVAVTVFPAEIYRAPRSWGRAHLRQPHLLERGRQGRPLRRLGGAAAVLPGSPQLFSQEVRAAFRPLR
jgi:hypothetical protein